MDLRQLHQGGCSCLLDNLRTHLIAARVEPQQPRGDMARIATDRLTHTESNVAESGSVGSSAASPRSWWGCGVSHPGAPARFARHPRAPPDPASPPRDLHRMKPAESTPLARARLPGRRR